MSSMPSNQFERVWAIQKLSVADSIKVPASSPSADVKPSRTLISRADKVVLR